MHFHKLIHNKVSKIATSNSSISTMDSTTHLAWDIFIFLLLYLILVEKKAEYFTYIRAVKH